MRLIGLMPVRNEAWCLAMSARVALLWCDGLVVLLHACTDESAKIIEEIRAENPGRVVIRTHRHECWTEMAHRQQMLEIARGMQATHIAIIDADEVLSGNLLPDETRTQWQWYPRASDSSMVHLPGYNLRGSLNRYHANGIWGKRWFSTVFRDDPALSWSGDKFHSREPQGRHLMPYQAVAQGAGGIMHLWGVSERRLKAKHALYKLNERLRWPNKSVAEIDRMYNWAIRGEPGHSSFGTPETWTYADVPSSWWAPYSHLMKYLDVNAEPWQEQECVRIIKEHGPRMFEGLDLFGVV